MNLYILNPVEEWTPWYDKMFGIVVRADTEEAARKLATLSHGDEGPDVWLDSDKTSCEILTAEGKEEVVIVNFAAA